MDQLPWLGPAHHITFRNQYNSWHKVKRKFPIVNWSKLFSNLKQNLMMHLLWVYAMGTSFINIQWEQKLWGHSSSKWMGNSPRTFFTNRWRASIPSTRFNHINEQIIWANILWEYHHWTTFLLDFHWSWRQMSASSWSKIFFSLNLNIFSSLP